MTDIQALADCIVSGQVPDEQVPCLVLGTPGLAAELKRRSSATFPALTVEAGRGASISSPDFFRPANSPSLTGQICITGRLSPAERAQVEFLMRNGPVQLLEPVNSPNLPSDGALAHRLGEEESRRPLKTRGLLSKLIRSIHMPSFLRSLLRK